MGIIKVPISRDCHVVRVKGVYLHEMPVNSRSPICVNMFFSQEGVWLHRQGRLRVVCK